MKTGGGSRTYKISKNDIVSQFSIKSQDQYFP